MASAFQLALPMVLRSAIDSLQSARPGDLLLHYTALFALLALGQAVAKYLSRQLFLGGARRVEHDLRGAYFGRLIRLPAGRIEAGRKGDFVSRATRDLQDIRLFLGAGALNFLQTLVLLLAATVLLWEIHPVLTLIALAPFPVVSLVVRRYSPRLHRRYLVANERAGDLAGLVQEALTGLRVVRAYRREAWQEERFAALNRAARDAQAAVIRTWALLFPMVGVLAGLGHVAVLGFGGYWVSQGVLTLGDFVAFNAYLAMLTWPMVALGWTLSLVQRGAAALDRLREVLEWSFPPAGNQVRPRDAEPCLSVRAVHFAYDGARTPALDGADLELPEGGFWGLVGGTGAGKSTLVALLAGLRQPSRGTISFRGVPLDELSPATLRAQLAVVPQEDYFFADTIAANVCLGRARDDEKLSWALETAGLTNEVSNMPRGVGSRVGEGGVTLSGGQRQRLAIARALYGEPRALLLDAALSSLDTETARRVLAGIRSALPGLSLLVVSHRGSEVDDAEGVYFLSMGRIAARGPHRELLATVPAYLRLYREEELRRELGEAAA